MWLGCLTFRVLSALVSLGLLVWESLGPCGYFACPGVFGFAGLRVFGFGGLWVDVVRFFDL